LTPKQLTERIERTRQRNKTAIRSAERRSSRLDRAAAQSTKVVERAVKQLREIS